LEAFVSDNGIGAPIDVFAQAKSGLGTSIVNALAEQLEARVDVVSGRQGTLGTGYPRHFC
jgi:two-component sensor histidine kinase